MTLALARGKERQSDSEGKCQANGQVRVDSGHQWARQKMGDEPQSRTSNWKGQARLFSFRSVNLGFGKLGLAGFDRVLCFLPSFAHPRLP